HFQGYCRDLYSECSQIVVARVRATLRELMLTQFSAHRKLDHGNPSIQNIREDFERFGFTLDLSAADPANGPRLTHLGELNRWRNVAAHHGTVPLGLPALTLTLWRTWRDSCDGLAVSLDAVA